MNQTLQILVTDTDIQIIHSNLSAQGIRSTYLLQATTNQLTVGVLLSTQP
jgi:hypothetical protein